MSRRTRSRNAYESQLAATLASGGSSVDVDSATGLIAPCYLVLAPNDAAKREFIEVGNIATNTLSGIVRNLDGSAPGAPFEHASGTVVRAVPTHQHLDDIFLDIEDLEQADTDHFGGTDTSDHPEASTGVRGFMSAADKSKLNSLNPSLQHAEDHASRHAPGGADELDLLDFEVEVDESVEVAGPISINPSFTTIASVDLEIPSSWSSWKCVAYATWVDEVAAGAGGGHRRQARMIIDGVFQPQDHNVVVSVGDEVSAALGARETGLTTTGTRTVSMQCVQVAGSGDLSAKGIFLYARAVRTS